MQHLIGTSPRRLEPMGEIPGIENNDTTAFGLVQKIATYVENSISKIDSRWYV